MTGKSFPQYVDFLSMTCPWLEVNMFRFSWTKMLFWKRRIQFRQVCQNYFAESPNKMMNLNTLWKKLPRNVSLNTLNAPSITRLKILKWCPKFFSHSHKKYLFFETTSLTKMFIWTLRMEFWQPCQIFFARSPKKNLCSNSGRSTFFQIFSKMFL